jgi:uncharacterized protein
MRAYVNGDQWQARAGNRGFERHRRGYCQSDGKGRRARRASRAARGCFRSVAAEITAADGTARTFPVDLADANAVEAFAKQVTKELGTPDIIINNAGAGRWLCVDETSPAEAVEMMAVPYFAAFYVTRAFLPAMLQRNSGHIVNISSVGSRFVWPGATPLTSQYVRLYVALRRRCGRICMRRTSM